MSNLTQFFKLMFEFKRVVRTAADLYRRIRIIIGTMEYHLSESVGGRQTVHIAGAYTIGFHQFRLLPVISRFK